MIHRESPPGVWTPIHTQAAHESSVNSIAWAPHEYGLVLGCASADGTVTILKHMDDDSWSCDRVTDGSRLGCNSISFAPLAALAANGGASLPPLKFATGSCDKTMRVWVQGADGSWSQPAALPVVHDDWVRDVAWAPNTASPSSMVASASEDGSVMIWTQSQVPCRSVRCWLCCGELGARAPRVLRPADGS